LFVDRIVGCFGLQAILRKSFARRTPSHRYFYPIQIEEKREKSQLSILLAKKDISEPTSDFTANAHGARHWAISFQVKARS